VSAAGDFGLGEVIRRLAGAGAGGFEWYKESCLLRRVEVRMRARKVGTLTGYAALLADDPAEIERLLHVLSVRVTGFFRNPESWVRLRELLATDGSAPAGRLTGWSMGCSTGEEAWSLAMLLSAHARGAREPVTVRVTASDVDAQALRAAQAGRYPAGAVAAIAAVLGDGAAVAEGEHFAVPSALRALVRFHREDLTAPLPRPGLHDVICCRNVLIFLGREGQRRVLAAAVEALRPGGLLLLGRTESLVALPDARLVPADITHRIYRKTP
jgi:two-component system CheB/CheR fusion protein